MPTMRAYLLAFLIAPLVLAVPAGIQAKPSPNGLQQPAASQQQEVPQEARAGLEEGIKNLLVSQVEAWNHGDLQGFMQGYWHSPDLTFFSGATVTKGWEPTLSRYRQRYQAEGKEMGKLEFQDLDIDLLSRRSAVVTGKWQLTMSNGKQPHGLFTLIFKRMPNGWRIVHDHTSAAE
ncbi:MAG TPA: nuclear transport factor 2 family protein [Candidatus Angelobacter sp.]|nr:nuclear transport factor 2 family protein [Candidatus Angelobacter sp.]